MMSIYIISAILFFIVSLLWKNSYYNRKPIYEIKEYESGGYKYTREGKLIGYEYYNRNRMPLWLFLLLIIAFLIPIINVIVPLIILIAFLRYSCEGDVYIHFNEKSLWNKVGRVFKRIGKFLNKDIF